MRTRTWISVLSGLLVLCSGPNACANLTLDISNAVNANLQFVGSGSGATFTFNNNSSVDGFQITLSTGAGDSVGLFGTLSGTFSYTTGSIVTTGITQTATVTSSSADTLTINDGSGGQLTGTVTIQSISTTGVAGGSINASGVINLTNVSYSGSNKDLTQLATEAAGSGGGVLTISFTPGKNLTQLAANGSSKSLAYSGTIATVSVSPEPSSVAIASVGALLLAGYSLRRRARVTG